MLKLNLSEKRRVNIASFPKAKENISRDASLLKMIRAAHHFSSLSRGEDTLVGIIFVKRITIWIVSASI